MWCSAKASSPLLLSRRSHKDKDGYVCRPCVPCVSCRYNVALLDVSVGSFSLGLPSFVYGYDNDAIG